MSATISLPQGKVAIVDEADFEWLSQWQWCLNSNGYARRRLPTRKGKQFTALMHREIMMAGPGQEVDHINGDHLDNRRANLRLCTHLENSRNRGPQSNNNSGFKGVHWYAQTQRWQAQIKAGSRRIHLGYFVDKLDAARTYDEAARDHFGAFAALNFQERVAS